MNKETIEQNLQWLRETLCSIQGINEQISTLVNMRINLEHQLIPMVNIIKLQLDKGNITKEDLIGLENIFNIKEIDKIDEEVNIKRIVKGDELCDLVYSILIENQTPLYYKDILLKINNKGFIVNGKNPGLNLIAHISKDKRFKKGNEKGCYLTDNNYLKEG